ncbi:hypothetical protein HMPREF9080_00021 [Cardiobacterium valvarum F0432]|uniref:Uncharacterized protein n=1 Tax=Cardiobacterium valvarum F0432 TaxID=797473 RepID=G9ZB99_9GAMM|nr:hypothetical protein HMPREF9080_00021 [Cardiobacterium valvarum F0432]
MADFFRCGENPPLGVVLTKTQKAGCACSVGRGPPYASPVFTPHGGCSGSTTVRRQKENVETLPATSPAPKSSIYAAWRRPKT